MMPESEMLGWDGYGYGSGMGFFGWLFMLAFWGLFIVGVVGVARWLRVIGKSGTGSRPGGGRKPRAQVSATIGATRRGSN